MNPILPTCHEGVPVIIGASSGAESSPLPARRTFDLLGSVITEWQLSEEERTLIAQGENIRLTTLTYGQPLQRMTVAITTPEGD